MVRFQTCFEGGASSLPGSLCTHRVQNYTEAQKLPPEQLAEKIKTLELD